MAQVMMDMELDLMACIEQFERECKLPLYKQAIAGFLVEHMHWLDVRELWREELTAFFRVNIWSTGDRVGDARITKSLFLAVDEHEGGLRVRTPHAKGDLSPQPAAGW